MLQSGFTTTAEYQKRLQAVIHRGIRSGLCKQEHKTLEDFVNDGDDKLFTNVLYNKQHVVLILLPGATENH